MKVTILEEDKSKMVIEIKGEDHTLCNAIRKELWEVKGVRVAGYNINHPMVGNPKLIIEADDPKKALNTAIESLKKKNSDLLKKFEKL